MSIRLVHCPSPFFFVHLITLCFEDVMPCPRISTGAVAMPKMTQQSFAIPLKHTAKPVAFPADFEKHIALEFAMRYLTEIGATPTLENCRMVLKEMPLEKCHVTAAWRSRGCLSDAIIIQTNGAAGSISAGGLSGKIGEAPPAPVGGGAAAGQAGCTSPGGTGDSANSRRRGRGGDETESPLPSRKRGTQPPSSMGRASPQKVSLFVDTVASALEPSVTEPITRPKTTAGDGRHIAKASGNNTSGYKARSSVTARGRPHHTCGRYPRTNSKVGSSGDRHAKLLRNAREGTKSGEGVDGDNYVLEGGMDQRSEETEDEKRAALAEARTKLLNPPKVDMAAIATVQGAFARNFPFRKHGPKLADKKLRAHVKDLIKADGNGRLIGLLSHYLFWMLLLPFALAHKDEDEALLSEMENTAPRRKRSRRRGHDRKGTSTTKTLGSTTKTASSTVTDQSDNQGRSTPHAIQSGRVVANEINPQVKSGTSREPACQDSGRAQLTEEEAEELFVTVVEAWSSIRASLGTSRHAKLLRLPIVAATVRNGLQTVLCNCYPFLERGGEQGRRLLAALHEEVATRFIPRFYYEGPFTPVAEEESSKGSALHKQRGNAPMQPLMRREGGGNFLYSSDYFTTGGGACEAGQNGTATPGVGTDDFHEASNVVGERTKSARDHPADTRRPGEAFFTTSNTFRYVFPKPCSPEARIMIASKERTRSTRCHTGDGRSNAWRHTAAGPHDVSVLINRAATTIPGIRDRSRVNAAQLKRGVAFGSTIGISQGPGSKGGITGTAATTGLCGNVNRTSSTTPSVGADCSADQNTNSSAQHSSGWQNSPKQSQDLPLSSLADAQAIGSGNEGRCRVPQTPKLRGSATAKEYGGLRVGTAAKARLYRGYCVQRAGDYEREYRRRGDKEMLGRRYLLTR